MIDRFMGGMQELVSLGALFSALWLMTWGLGRLRAERPDTASWRLNLVYFFIDLVVLVPVLTVLAQALDGGLQAFGLAGLCGRLLADMPDWLVLVLAVAVSDLVGYWRHRLMHMAPLWPVHAAHHSDRDVNWLTLVRFHPLNRLVAVVLNTLVLVMIGFPVWAVVLNGWIRHFYGYYVHAELPWRYGPLRYIFVSPHLHRWHHATEMEARDRNFATVFSLYDVIFGTFYCPRAEAKTLGLDDPAYPSDWWGQTLHPFRVWGRSLRTRFRAERPRSGVPAD